jgi:iron complex transport system ATP-binding protein
VSRPPLLEASGVSVNRGGREVLREVDLRLIGGEALALVGPNAAGKSTLVRALAGLLRPRHGVVRLEGRDLTGWPRAAVARRVALVTPDDEGVGSLTVGDRVALGRYPHRGPFRPLTRDDDDAVRGALEATGIGELAQRSLSTLSAGERQLAALARGLAQEPRVLLLDEPAAHLDIGHQLQLFHVLDEVRARGVAVLAVVHDLQRAAMWAERLVLLAGGQVVAAGDPAMVLLGEAAARAFGVAIDGHAVPGVAGRLYSFQNGKAPGPEAP